MEQVSIIHKKKKFLLGNAKSAMDVYENTFVVEKRDGEVARVPALVARPWVRGERGRRALGPVRLEHGHAPRPRAGQAVRAQSGRVGPDLLALRVLGRGRPRRRRTCQTTPNHLAFNMTR